MPEIFRKSSRRTLVPTSQPINPLETYPNRDWEQVYRDQYSYDGSFTWVCSPNDTHACRLRAFVKSRVVLRSEQNYDSANVGAPGHIARRRGELAEPLPGGPDAGVHSGDLVVDPLVVHLRARLREQERPRGLPSTCTG